MWSWIGGQGGDLIFGIFEVALAGPETFLCLFWPKDHTKSCACKNLRDRKKDEEHQSIGSEIPEQRVSQLGMRLWSGGSDIQSSERGAGQSRTKTQSSESDDQMIQHFWYLSRIFAIVPYKFIQECLRVSTSLLAFVVLNLGLSVYSSHPLFVVCLLFFFFFFLYNLWNSHTARCEN